jgi:ELWxxDGT repeat protein
MRTHRSLPCLVAFLAAATGPIAQTTLSNSNPREFVTWELLPIVPTYFFASTDGVTVSLCSTPPAPGPVTRLATFRANGPGSQPNGLVMPAPDRLFFAAAGSTSTSGEELWTSNGSAAGTVQVADLRPGVASSRPRHITPLGSRVFFSANDGTRGRELWVSDGTSAGTTLVRDIRSGAESSDPADLVVLGQMLLFTANDGVNGRELWRSDGTSSGTARVAPGAGVRSPIELTLWTTEVLFAAETTADGFELWTTDGTAQGTRRIKDIRPGAAGSMPRGLTSTLLGVVFVADDGVHGAEPWITDGTEAGTALLFDIRAGSAGSDVGKIVGVLWGVCLVADDGVAGRELWFTNGSSASTRLARDIWPGADGSRPDQLVRLDLTTVLFTADDGQRGRELWRSDGDAAGTFLVVDAKPGPCASRITGLTRPSAFGALALFAADADGTPAGKGIELHVTDGTPAGTRLVADINAASDQPELDVTQRANGPNIDATFKISGAHPNSPAAIFFSFGLATLALPGIVGNLRLGLPVFVGPSFVLPNGSGSVTIPIPAGLRVDLAVQGVTVDPPAFTDPATICTGPVDLSSCPQCAGLVLELIGAEFQDDTYSYVMPVKIVGTAPAKTWYRVWKRFADGDEIPVTDPIPVEPPSVTIQGEKSLGEGEALEVRLYCGNPDGPYCVICKLGC